jgi:hypothetical protein
VKGHATHPGNGIVHQPAQRLRTACIPEVIERMSAVVPNTGIPVLQPPEKRIRDHAGFFGLAEKRTHRQDLVERHEGEAMSYRFAVLLRGKLDNAACRLPQVPSVGLLAP